MLCLMAVDTDKMAVGMETMAVETDNMAVGTGAYTGEMAPLTLWGGDTSSRATGGVRMSVKSMFLTGLRRLGSGSGGNGGRLLAVGAAAGLRSGSGVRAEG